MKWKTGHRLTGRPKAFDPGCEYFSSRCMAVELTLVRACVELRIRRHQRVVKPLALTSSLFPAHTYLSLSQMFYCIWKWRQTPNLS